LQLIGPLCAPRARGNFGEYVVGLRLWLFVAAMGGLAHLILFIADREIRAGEDRLSEVRLMRPDGLDRDPNQKLVNARSPYTRNER
jgi:hypothetical protein